MWIGAIMFHSLLLSGCISQSSKTQLLIPFLAKFPDATYPMHFVGGYNQGPILKQKIEQPEIEAFLCGQEIECNYSSEEWADIEYTSICALNSEEHDYIALIVHQKMGTTHAYWLHTYSIQGESISTLFLSGMQGTTFMADATIEADGRITIHSGIPKEGVGGEWVFTSPQKNLYRISSTGKIIQENDK